MKKSINLSLMVCIIIFVNACTATKRISLAEHYRSKTQNVKLVICLPQDDIAADIDTGSAEVAGQVGMQYGAIGGLLGGLVEEGIRENKQREANELIKPIRGLLKARNIEKNLSEEINDKICHLKWLNIKSIDVVSKTEKDDVANIPDGIAEDGLLLVNMSYNFHHSFKVLMVKYNFVLYMKDNHKNPVLRDEVLFVSKGIQSENKSDAIQQWAQDDGVKLKASLEDSMHEIASLILFELENDTDGSYKGNNRRYVRDGEGKLISIPISE